MKIRPNYKFVPVEVVKDVFSGQFINTQLERGVFIATIDCESHRENILSYSVGTVARSKHFYRKTKRKAEELIKILTKEQRPLSELCGNGRFVQPTFYTPQDRINERDSDEGRWASADFFFDQLSRDVPYLFSNNKFHSIRYLFETTKAHPFVDGEGRFFYTMSDVHRVREHFSLPKYQKGSKISVSGIDTTIYRSFVKI